MRHATAAPRHRPALPWLPLLILLTLPAPQALAQRVMHRVRFGETLADISKAYYDDAEQVTILRLANGFGPRRKLQAGERIRVPTAYVHTVRRRTTVKRLAKQLLGDARRWPALAHFNKLGRRNRIKTGTPLVVPFTLEHLIEPGQTLQDLAQLYYKIPRLAGLIGLYNFTADPAPKPGTRVEIPIGAVQITRARMDELVRARLLGISPATRTGEREALQESNAMLRRGQYWAVPLRLVRLLAKGEISDAHLVEVFKLLAIAYVAVDRAELARRAFHEVLLRRPGYTLNPIVTSPKVYRVFEDARDKVKGK